MKLKGEYAVVGYCPDLTSPRAKSVPVAVLLIAREDTTASLAGAAAVTRMAGLDPIGASFLSKISAILKEHVDLAVKRRPNAAPHDLLRDLHNSLRNTLHVSRIKELDPIELPDSISDDELKARVLGRVARLLQTERAAAGIPEVALGQKQRPGSVPAAPVQQVWSIQEACA